MVLYPAKISSLFKHCPSQALGPKSSGMFQPGFDNPSLEASRNSSVISTNATGTTTFLSEVFIRSSIHDQFFRSHSQQPGQDQAS